MARNKKQTFRRDPLPENFNLFQEFWEFWDTHSTADYEDFMEEIDVQLNLGSNKIYYAVAKDLIAIINLSLERSLEPFGGTK